VLPLVVVLVRDRPADLGLAPYGGDHLITPQGPARGNAAGLALDALRKGVRTKAFWALAGAFAICGATTNGLIGIHFIPSAHDHGMATTTAAGLLMLVGVFDIVGTVASGWLTDRIDPRWLLLVYYTFRGVGLLLLPWLLADTVHPSMVVFIVVYGLDWVATVPPTVALCRRLFGSQGTIVFGWVFASHQLGAAAAALTAGIIRDTFGTYTYAWFGGAALCVFAAVLSIGLRRHDDVPPTTTPTGTHDRDIAAETISDLTP
jgi:predicted MFS family arabinose efflux permease